jgi:hypothetical protein
MTGPPVDLTSYVKSVSLDEWQRQALSFSLAAGGRCVDSLRPAIRSAATAWVRFARAWTDQLAVDRRSRLSRMHSMYRARRR